MASLLNDSFPAINASSAVMTANLLRWMGVNIGASSGLATATSAQNLFGFAANLVAASGTSNATSAGILFNAVANLQASSSTLTLSSSGLLYQNQLLGASSTVLALANQGQLGWKYSS